MYAAFRTLCERLLRIPPDPEPPPGDEGTTRIFRAAPNFFKYLLCLWAVRSLAVLIAFTVGLVPLFVAASQMRGWGWLLPLLGLLALLAAIAGCLASLAVLRLNYEKRWYLVTNRSFRIREGVWTVKEMTVNFANIQNVSVSQGPIQRMLGIADLRVDTAGGGGASVQTHGAGPNLHTAWFRGVNNAPEIRDLIQARVGALKDAGLGDQAEPAVGAEPGGLLHVTPEVRQALAAVQAEARALRLRAEGL